jgi:hypothetical protein
VFELGGRREGNLPVGWGAGLGCLCPTIDVLEWNSVIKWSTQPVDVARNVIWFRLSALSDILHDLIMFRCQIDRHSIFVDFELARSFCTEFISIV